MTFPQPAIEILGLRINEPVTTLTDLMVAAVCFYAFFRLSNAHQKSKISFYLRFYFLSMGIATSIGGIIGHGFLYAFEASWSLPENYIRFISSVFGESKMNEAANPWKLPGWLTSMFSIALVERAAIEYARKIVPSKLARFFLWLNIIELLIFVSLTFTTLNFYFVEIHTAYGLLLIVGSFSLYSFIKTKRKASGLFIIAVIFSSIGALFFMNQWSLHTWFNFLDISHVFLSLSAWFFYKGSQKMLK